MKLKHVTLLVLRIWRSDCFKVHVRLIFKVTSRIQETERVFVSVLVKKQSRTAICKIYGFEYVTRERTQFVKAWTVNPPFL